MILGWQVSKSLDSLMHTCFGEDLALEKYEMQEKMSCSFKDCKPFEWKFPCILKVLLLITDLRSNRNK